MGHLVQVVGALLVLSAFALVQARVLTSQARVYLLLNAVGASVLAWDAYGGRQWGFLLLEGAWALIAVWGLVRSRRPGGPRGFGHVQGTGGFEPTAAAGGAAPDLIGIAAAFYNSGNMPGAAELDRLLARIAEMQTMLRLTESDDVREMVGQTLADLEARLAEVTAELDAGPVFPGQLDPARASS